MIATLHPDPVPPARIARVTVSYSVMIRSGNSVWRCVYPIHSKVWRRCVKVGF